MQNTALMNVFYKYEGDEASIIIHPLIISDSGIVFGGEHYPRRKIKSWRMRYLSEMGRGLNPHYGRLEIHFASYNPLQFIFLPYIWILWMDDDVIRGDYDAYTKRIYEQNDPLDSLKQPFETWCKSIIAEAEKNRKTYLEVTNALNMMLAS